MAYQHLKSPWSLSNISAHPTMATIVNIVMNGWLTSFSFHVNRPSHSWDKAISDSDLSLKLQSQGHGCDQRARSCSRPGQYPIYSLPYHLTSIRLTIPEIELFRNLTLKHPRSRSWVRSKVKVTYFTQYPTNAVPFRVTSIGPTSPEIWPKLCLTLKKWASEWLSSTAFLVTADIGVHVVHISRVIITYILGSLSSLT